MRFAAVGVFVDELLAELAAMAKDGAWPMRSGPNPPSADRHRARPSCDLVCLLPWLAVAGAGETLGIIAEAISCGRDGRFVPPASAGWLNSFSPG